MEVEAIKLRGQLDVELKERKEFEDSKSSGWYMVQPTQVGHIQR